MLWMSVGLVGPASANPTANQTPVSVGAPSVGGVGRRVTLTPGRMRTVLTSHSPWFRFAVRPDPAWLRTPRPDLLAVHRERPARSRWRRSGCHRPATSDCARPDLRGPA